MHRNKKEKRTEIGLESISGGGTEKEDNRGRIVLERDELMELVSDMQKRLQCIAKIRK